METSDSVCPLEMLAIQSISLDPQHQSYSEWTGKKMKTPNMISEVGVKYIYLYMHI